MYADFSALLQRLTGGIDCLVANLSKAMYASLESAEGFLTPRPLLSICNIKWENVQYFAVTEKSGRQRKTRTAIKPDDCIFENKAKLITGVFSTDKK